MDSWYSRLLDAAGCSYQIELADFLGTRQSLISDAKRRDRIPSDWLDFLHKTKSVRSEWILHGTPSKYENTKE